MDFYGCFHYQRVRDCHKKTWIIMVPCGESLVHSNKLLRNCGFSDAEAHGLPSTQTSKLVWIWEKEVSVAWCPCQKRSLCIMISLSKKEKEHLNTGVASFSLTFLQGHPAISTRTTAKPPSAKRRPSSPARRLWSGRSDASQTPHGNRSDLGEFHPYREHISINVIT